VDEVCLRESLDVLEGRGPDFEALARVSGNRCLETSSSVRFTVDRDDAPAPLQQL
jgi:hypothetical protein